MTNKPRTKLAAVALASFCDASALEAVAALAGINVELSARAGLAQAHCHRPAAQPH